MYLEDWVAAPNTHTHIDTQPSTGFLNWCGVRDLMCPKVTWVTQLYQLWPTISLNNKCQDPQQAWWGTKAHKAEPIKVVMSLA